MSGDSHRGHTEAHLVPAVERTPEVVEHDVPHSPVEGSRCLTDNPVDGGGVGGRVWGKVQLQVLVLVKEHVHMGLYRQ